MYGIDVNDPNSILLNDKQIYITHTDTLEGILSMYQISSTKQANGQKVVYYRLKHCSWLACLYFNYSDCVYKGEGDPIIWKRIDLKTQPKQVTKNER